MVIKEKKRKNMSMKEKEYFIYGCKYMSKKYKEEIFIATWKLKSIQAKFYNLRRCIEENRRDIDKLTKKMSVYDNNKNKEG